MQKGLDTFKGCWLLVLTIAQWMRATRSADGILWFYQVFLDGTTPFQMLKFQTLSFRVSLRSASSDFPSVFPAAPLGSQLEPSFADEYSYVAPLELQFLAVLKCSGSMEE